MTTIHTKELQQHTRQLTTIKTRQLTTIYTRQLTTIHTRQLKIQHVEKVSNTIVRKYCTQFPVFFPTHIVLTNFIPALHFSPLYYSYKPIP